MNDPLPYLTADLPGIGGTLKAEVEDFVVDEIPADEPEGAGEFVYRPTDGLLDGGGFRADGHGLMTGKMGLDGAALIDAALVRVEVLKIHLNPVKAVGELTGEAALDLGLDADCQVIVVPDVVVRSKLKEHVDLL